MKKKIGVLLSVLFAFIALFALVGCNGKGKNFSQETMTLLIFEDNEEEDRKIEMVKSCPVYRDRITRVYLPRRRLLTDKGRYLYCFYSGEPFDETGTGSVGKELQDLATFDEAGKYEVVYTRQVYTQPYNFVAWVFIDGKNSTHLDNYDDVRYEFDSCGAIGETDSETNGKTFVYEYDGKTHYPEIKVFYKEKELPCRVEVKARANEKSNRGVPYRAADGYVVNAGSYELNYYVYVDEEYIQAESLIRTVFGEGIVENIFVDIVE